MRLIITATITILAAIIGIVDSILSTLDHLRLHASGSLSGGYCQALLAGGCKAAHTSRWSEIFHVPISIYGIAFYFTVIILILAGMFRRQLRKDALKLGFGMSLLALLYCMFLGYILYTSGNFCPLCFILYMVNLILLIGLYLQIRFQDMGLLKGIKGFLWSRAVVLGTGTFILVTLIGFLVYSNALKTAGMQQNKGKISGIVQVDIPSIGPADARIQVLEISDFLCPFCERFFHNLEAVRKEMPDRIRVKFLQYPLDECNPYVGRAFHPSACLTASASLCAKKQGKFWPYVQLLYKNRHRHTIKELTGYADGLGMDGQAFKTCLQQPSTMKIIHKQVQTAHKMNVRGTPTFVVNGKVYVGARDKKALRRIFKNALRKKSE